MRVYSSDQRIGVTAPGEPGWEFIESIAAPAGVPTAMIKMRRFDRSEFTFFLAKEYVAGDDGLDAHTLVSKTFRATYERDFAEVRYDYVRNLTVHGVDWVEAGIQMRHHSLGLLAKQERVHRTGNQVLITSCEGLQDTLPRFYDAGQVWMDDAWFAALEDDLPGRH